MEGEACRSYRSPGTGVARLCRTTWLVACAIVAGSGDGDPSAARIVIAPYLRDATQDGITVVWETAEPHGTVLEYGSSCPLAHRIVVPGRGTMHKVRVTGLDAAHGWLYRIVAPSDDPTAPHTDVCSLHVARPRGHPITFAVVGDTQDQTGRWGAVAESIRSQRPEFLLHLGDIVEEGCESARWSGEFFRPGRRLLATTPTWAVIGNHEADDERYYRYFGGPSPGWRQSFEYGDAQVFLLDSERDLGPGSEQYAWLDAGLAASTAAWRIVALHRPVYTSDRDEYGDSRAGTSLEGDPRTRPLIPLLEARGVDILFCGHIHAYERTRPIRDGRVAEDGVVYLQSGGGGGRLEETADTPSWFTAAQRRCHHYLLVSVSAEAIEVRAFDEEGRLFDVWTRPQRPSRLAFAPATVAAAPPR